MIAIELETIRAQLETSRTLTDLFGQSDGSTEQQLDAVRRLYRRLARVVHPDQWTTETDKAMASELFAELTQRYERAQAAIGAGTYGEEAPIVLRTKNAGYTLGRLVAHGDVAALYVATTDRGDQVTAKVAKDPKSRDLMQAEAESLRILATHDATEGRRQFYSVLHDSFSAKFGTRNHAVNVLEWYPTDGFITLDAVRNRHPGGIDGRDMAWVLRRLLYALDGVHRSGLVHGAILPAHILIHPVDHAVILVDWCYSVESGRKIRAIVPTKRSWYPDEVLNRQPVGPGTDVHMAISCMSYLLGADNGRVMDSNASPRMRAFFKGCQLSALSRRPADTLALLAEFDDLIKRMYGKRKYRPLPM